MILGLSLMVSGIGADTASAIETPVLIFALLPDRPQMSSADLMP